MKKRKMRAALVCGMLGCLCFGGGDWLMLYGSPAYRGALSWLTEGVAAMPQWRFSLAMALAFPGIVLYGIALFAAQGFITGERQRKVYHYLNAFGLTPWMALHLFYIMILALYAWLNRNGFAGDATAVCEGLYAPFSWLIPASEAMMLPVFVWWFWLQITGKTVFPRRMAFANVLVIYGALKGVSLWMPVSALRLGFTNGLMSESMLIWFAILLIWKPGATKGEDAA